MFQRLKTIIEYFREEEFSTFVKINLEYIWKHYLFIPILPYAIHKIKKINTNNDLNKLVITEDLDEIKNADVVATDTWVSIWYKGKKEQILKKLKGYTVTKELMSKAKPDAIFMHCMPIFYDAEVTKEVAHGPQSVIIDEAENRMWAEMTLVMKLLKN